MGVDLGNERSLRSIKESLIKSMFHNSRYFYHVVSKVVHDGGLHCEHRDYKSDDWRIYSF